jgi:hypothetical protein
MSRFRGLNFGIPADQPRICSLMRKRIGKHGRLAGSEGGGGFGTEGGKSGNANTDNIDPVGEKEGGVAGKIRGNETLIPLIGGCAGGSAGDCPTPGGAGGGAVQISVAGYLDVNGTVWANGGDGESGCGTENEQGGTGGGAGGGILLEAMMLDTTDSTIEAAGGKGGLCGASCGAFKPHCGVSSGGVGAASADTSGNSGEDNKGGGPEGWRRLRTNCDNSKIGKVSVWCVVSSCFRSLLAFPPIIGGCSDVFYIRQVRFFLLIT